MRQYIFSEEPPHKKINYLRRKIIAWGHNNYDDYPWRSAENGWLFLVAEIMLQRTNADQAVASYMEFRKNYPTPEAFINNYTEGVFDNLGLRWREVAIVKLANILREHTIPKDQKGLMGLPGVGQYMSAAYLSLYLNRRGVLVDSNIIRMYGRYFGFLTNDRTRYANWLYILADKVTPSKGHKQFNYGLIDYTRNICKKKALCNDCIIKHQCTLHRA
jgi:A/G-specific adenine glycosylase